MHTSFYSYIYFPIYNLSATVYSKYDFILLKSYLYWFLWKWDEPWIIEINSTH